MKEIKEENKVISFLNKLITVVAITMTITHLYTYAVGLLPAMQQRTLFLGFVLALIFLMQIRDKLRAGKIDLLSWFFLLGSVGGCIYIFFNWNLMAMRTMSPIGIDIVIAILILAAVCKGTSLHLGIALPLIAIGFIFYALLGYRLNGDFVIGYFSLPRIATYLTMETSGIFGTVLGTAAKYIFVFIIFGAFLEKSGASEFFMKLTNKIIGGRKGSGAKVDVISSGLFGMISGSAVANVVTTGPITIPMMKQNGFDGKFAGAVSSIAGTGGQLMPPIMGTAAFIIAETLAMSYREVSMAAIIPGLLFYITLWASINFRANRLGIKGNPRKEQMDCIIKESIFYVLPVVFLIMAIIVLRWSPIKAGLWATVLVVLLSFLNSKNRMGLKKIVGAMEQAAYSSLCVGVVCATAGIVIGVLALTGIGIKFSGMLISLSGGNIILLLLLTMISGIILGMGMTTTSVYIILSVLVAPALISAGIEPIAAHLFVFYYGILSCITPPVATAAYAAASIAKENPMKLAFFTTKIAIPIYILPIIFVFNPALLMIDANIFQVVAKLGIAIVLLCSIAAAIEGYYRTNIPVLFRIILAVAPFIMLQPNIWVELIVAIICSCILAQNYVAGKNREKILSENIV